MEFMSEVSTILTIFLLSCDLKWFDGLEFFCDLEFSFEECDLGGKLRLVEKVVNSESKAYKGIDKVKNANPMLDDVETFSKFITIKSNAIQLHEVTDITRYSF